MHVYKHTQISIELSYFILDVSSVSHLLGPVGTIISGGVGGLALWTAIFPADVVKSRIQVQSTVGKAAPSFLSVLLMVFKTEG